MLRFVDRVGRALVAPRAALRATDDGDGGSGDALWLLMLKFLCGEARAIVAAGWALVVIGPGAALPALMARLSSVLGVDLVTMLVGGVVVTVAAGRKRSIGRDFDMACTAWIPVLVVDAAASLVTALLGIDLPAAAVKAIWAAALGWMAALVVLAVQVARGRPGAPEAAGS